MNNDIDIDLIKSYEILMSFYGFSFDKYNLYRRTTWIMILLLILSWSDIIWGTWVVIKGLQTDDKQPCYFLEIGCLILSPKLRRHGNFLMTAYRCISFQLYNIFYFFDNYDWFCQTNTHFEILMQNIPDKFRRFTSNKKLICFGQCMTNTITIIYNIVLFGMCYFANGLRSWQEILLNHLIITCTTYFCGFFVIQNYLLNNICACALRTYNEWIKYESKSMTELHTMKQFAVLVLMIQNAKVYLKSFYLVMISCLFGVTLEFFYMTFYADNIDKLLNYFAAFTLITFTSYIIYFSLIPNRIEIEAKRCSKLIYKQFAIDIIKYRDYGSNIQEEFDIGMSFQNVNEVCWLNCLFFLNIN